MEHNETSSTDAMQKPAYFGHGAEPFDLVLEGGAMRGVFTSGVLDFFMEKGLFAQQVIGTSAGALNAYNYVAGQIGRTCLINAKYCSDWHYLSLKNYVRTGNAVGIDLMYHRIPLELEPFDFDAFRKSPSFMTSVASNLELGEADYHSYTDPMAEVDYLVATAAMPLVSQIVEVDGKKLLDGGICDSVPLLFSMMCGTRKQIVVLTQPEGYIKPSYKLMALAHQRYGAYPHFVERMQMRPYEYNRTYRMVKRMQEAGDIFVIRPPEPADIGQMESNPEKVIALYEVGYAEAAKNWEGVQRYLEL